MADDEVLKLQRHLSLLREEYVKLQEQLIEVEKKHQVALATAGRDGEDSFVSRLLRIVSGLYDKDLYSDLQVEVGDRVIRAHKFVLAARGDHWGVPDMSTATRMSLDGLSYDVGVLLLKWVYTGRVESKGDSDKQLSLLKAAVKYRLDELKLRCEQLLMSYVTARTCIRYYQTADEIGADALKQHCSELISSHWEDFTSDDFASMPAPLLYRMMKAKTDMPLHRAVRAHREDVVFLYIVEFSSKLPVKLNERDAGGSLPLDLALRDRQESLAHTLVRNGANVNIIDPTTGETLLHKAVKSDDHFSAIFLLKNGANANVTMHDDLRSPLHLLAAVSPVRTCAKDMVEVARHITSVTTADVNLQDRDGNTALHLAVLSGNTAIFDVLLQSVSLDPDLINAKKQTALWLSLTHPGSNGQPCYSNGSDATGFAAKLVARGSNTSMRNEHTGDTLLHEAAALNMEAAALFLANHGANMNSTNFQGETPLHVACRMGLLQLVECLLKRGSNPNVQTSAAVVEDGRSKAGSRASSDGGSHSSRRSSSDERGRTAAVKVQTSLATSLDSETINRKASVKSNPFLTEDEENEYSEREVGGRGSALASRHYAEVSVASASCGEEQVGSSGEVESEVSVQLEACPGRQTPLHVAIWSRKEDIVFAILSHKEKVMRLGDDSVIIPNFSLRDTADQTPLAAALWVGMLVIARRLLAAGAGLDTDRSRGGETLLHQAIRRRAIDVCLFLLENRADVNLRTQKGESALELAVECGLPAVVETLGDRKAQLNTVDSKGNCPLWNALAAGRQDIASILVRKGCDTTLWSAAKDGSQETLLHRAITGADGSEEIACFLIRSLCDVNSPRQAGPKGEGDDAARSGQTPLHLAARRGLQVAVQCLLEHSAEVNARDSSGRTALHLAIEGEHSAVAATLLSVPALDVTLGDRQGTTVFAAAMTRRNNRIAKAILSRHPDAAEQMDNHGRNYLHVAVQKADIESLLFLISINANVNSRTQDSEQLSPLHLAVSEGSEIVVRNLLLAGANVNYLTVRKQTALHLAAVRDGAAVCSVLIESGVDFNAMDDQKNNALHVAVYSGSINACRILLTECAISAEAVNLKGQNPMHILGHYGKDNAAAIFELFMECMPQYPINKPDIDGNTVLLLAYLKGNGNLCRAIVRAGASIGAPNHSGISIFNAPVATKRLLFNLLNLLASEPPWTDGDTCLQCSNKFSIKNRKHHCRHCGRLLCAKCSEKEIPILKFGQSKPVRVCHTCLDVLTFTAQDN